MYAPVQPGIYHYHLRDLPDGHTTYVVRIGAQHQSVLLVDSTREQSLEWVDSGGTGLSYAIFSTATTPTVADPLPFAYSSPSP